MYSYRFKLLLFFFVSYLNAQNNPATVSIEIEKDVSIQKSTLVSLVLIVRNERSTTLKGELHFDLPKGFIYLGSSALDVEMSPYETRHIPVKFVITEDVAVAGGSLIVCKLINDSGVLLAEQSIVHNIEVDDKVTIKPLKPVVYRDVYTEPISVGVRVSNEGNLKQNITVVCKFPNQFGKNIFLEQIINIEAKKDTLLTFKYLPPSRLATKTNFLVSISGFRNPNKEIFGSTSVIIQNISSEQQYQEVDFTHFSEETQNQITSSYRSLVGGIDFYRIKGSGGFNIPQGSLFMRGDVAWSGSLPIPLVTNTRLSFRQNNNEYTLGNISNLYEMTFLGRGVEYSHTFNKNKKIELGFIDQNYNLIEKNNWLKNGYGFFLRGMLNTTTSYKNISATYLYRYDPYEKAKHNILGTEANYNFNQDWGFNAKLNGGLSIYELNDNIKPSFGIESNYIGKLKDINLNGNFFYSSNYYPGNRRGNTQLQQNISKSIKDNSLHASVIFSNFSPKYSFFSTNQESTNTRFEVGNRFPKLKDFSLNLLYQYQKESSNSYNAIGGGFGDNRVQKMHAHRIVDQISWVHNESMQSAILGIETGIVNYPAKTDYNFQVKLNMNYSIQSFNLNTVYQSGSYYLSQYAFSKVASEDKTFEKTIVSLFYNKNFAKDKVRLSSGVSYTKDVIYGKSPSAFFNLNYTSRVFNAFLNSSYYKYSIGTLATNSLTFEVGFTVKLKKTILNANKKGVIKLKVFYDTNNNNYLDADEEYAEKYLVNIDNMTLSTDSEGEAFYKKVPYGFYSLKQLIQDGWYYEDSKFEVDRHSYDLLIPLHQSGKMEGKVTFLYDSKTALSFDHKGSGIFFRVMKDDKLIQKIYTDDEGRFTSFLPTGKYTIILEEKSLPANTFCTVKSHEIEFKAGEIAIIPDFVIQVKERKVNIKKFSN